jgi:hypothetical protein
MKHPQTPQPEQETFDTVLRSELSWEAPPDLTHNLLALAQQHAAVASDAQTQPGSVSPQQPQAWYTRLVSALTVLAVGVSLLVAWQFYGLLGSELGLPFIWQELNLAFANGSAWVATQMPVIMLVLDTLGGIREYLHWILIAVVLWLALDGWSAQPQPAAQQQASSQV